MKGVDRGILCALEFWHFSGILKGLSHFSLENKGFSTSLKINQQIQVNVWHLKTARLLGYCLQVIKHYCHCFINGVVNFIITLFNKIKTKTSDIVTKLYIYTYVYSYMYMFISYTYIFTDTNTHIIYFSA